MLTLGPTTEPRDERSGVRMEIEVECDCGWTTRGEESRVVAATQVHMRLIHDGEITRKQVLAKAKQRDAGGE